MSQVKKSTNNDRTQYSAIHSQGNTRDVTPQDFRSLNNTIKFGSFYVNDYQDQFYQNTYESSSFIKEIAKDYILFDGVQVKKQEKQIHIKGEKDLSKTDVITKGYTQLRPLQPNQKKNVGQKRYQCRFKKQFVANYLQDFTNWEGKIIPEKEKYLIDKALCNQLAATSLAEAKFKSISTKRRMLEQSTAAPSIKGYPLYDDKQFQKQIKDNPQKKCDLFDDKKNFNIAEQQNKEDLRLQQIVDQNKQEKKIYNKKQEEYFEILEYTALVKKYNNQDIEIQLLEAEEELKNIKTFKEFYTKKKQNASNNYFLYLQQQALLQQQQADQQDEIYEVKQKKIRNSNLQVKYEDHHFEVD